MIEKPVALVTGGAKGIGAACCRALAAEGFYVGIHYNQSTASAQTLRDQIREGFLIQADLSDIGQVDAMIGKLKDTTGRVDVLVNNAGRSVNADIISMKVEQFDEQRTLTRGVWYLTKRILRQFMFRNSAGRIINISSVVGHTGNAGQIPYTMEKAALDAFTRSLARELKGRNILVNSVAPGFIDTEMTKDLPEEIKNKAMEDILLGRVGRPEEIAEVVAFLAKKGSYINGSVIHVNGGLYGG
ncbi:MAG TPA: 3-oxoacyl-ACP reductase family protein [Smithella sp.]|jgi:3-oxoacyl-[acyl-carrier protein] reductase|nr:3-oxoacyl-ACP reductase family protein [Smithella sp.]HOG09547.1 3-oxoacyl-ACP reductase family protein [Smithella sp.]HOS13610.1 3-oxoacyl-ACP reductase family protein [Smithella sp.]HPK22751.1 3-oxoacyl-ACP reductase family protein [Smithella sp.]HPL48153.1 3-oxoacyl-ACP reductase family protein [Smithella sp.]